MKNLHPFFALSLLIAAGCGSGSAVGSPQGGGSQLKVAGSSTDPKPIINLEPLLGKPLSDWEAALGSATGKEDTGDRHTILEFKSPKGVKTLYLETASGKVVNIGVTFNADPKFDPKLGSDWELALRRVGIWSSKATAGDASNPTFKNGDLNHIKIIGIPQTSQVEFWASNSDQTTGLRVRLSAS